MKRYTCILALVCLVSTTGCYNRYQIPASEMTKVNLASGPHNMFKQGEMAADAADSSSASTIDFELVDQRLARTRGRLNLMVWSSDGERHRFKYPVRVEQPDAQTFLVYSSNHRPRRFSLDEIDRVKVIEFDVERSVAAILTGELSVLTALVVIALL